MIHSRLEQWCRIIFESHCFMNTSTLPPLNPSALKPIATGLSCSKTRPGLTSRVLGLMVLCSSLWMLAPLAQANSGHEEPKKEEHGARKRSTVPRKRSTVPRKRSTAAAGTAKRKRRPNDPREPLKALSRFSIWTRKESPLPSLFIKKRVRSSIFAGPMWVSGTDR